METSSGWRTTGQQSTEPSVIISIYECYQSVFQSLIYNMKESAKALDLNAVQAFVFTAELQSFTRAAEALGTTQSAISLKLRQLEKHLGRRLLERTPRRVRLSAEGATFMQAARNLLGAHERAIASFGSTRRHLVVGVSHLIVGSEGPPALLRRMRDHDPNLLIELRVAAARAISRMRTRKICWTRPWSSSRKGDTARVK